MESIDDKILSNVKKRGRGHVYFPSDFASYGESKSVLKVLERLVNSQKLVRIARGIYYYPKIDKALGLGVLYPPLEAIASGIARRDKARIVPTGLYALNRLGLSTQIPMNIVYLTDGSPRKINLGDGRSILFKHTAPKNLAYQSELAMLIVFALKELTKEQITREDIGKIRELLKSESKERIMADAKLMPSWIKSIIIKVYE